MHPRRPCRQLSRQFCSCCQCCCPERRCTAAANGLLAHNGLLGSTRAAAAACPRLAAQLANVLSTEALFYTCIIPFIMFFGAFAFIMYPLRDVLHPTG